MQKVEKLVDFLIPYTLILLLIIILLELFFASVVEPYEHYILMLDYFILFVFIIDLVFKYKRSRDIPNFLKTSWLDIIAVFPFFLIFRLIEEFVSITKLGELTQSIFHETVEIEKAGQKVIREAGKTTRFSGRFIRIITRIPRFAKALPFFEKPSSSRKYAKSKRKG
jgi:hypothetical protein